MAEQHEALQRSAQISRLALAMSTAQSPLEALKQAAQYCCDMFPAISSVSVALLSKEGQDIKLHALHNPGGSQLHLVQRTMRSDTTLAGLASELKKVINIGDLAEGNLGLQDCQVLEVASSIVSMIAAPLVISGKAVGSLLLTSLQAHAFPRWDYLALTV
eukprot:jgi/Chrzof1/15056/Cz09g25150.t1